MTNHPLHRSLAAALAFGLLSSAPLPAQLDAIAKAAGSGKSADQPAKAAVDSPEQTRKRLTESALAWQAEADRLGKDFVPPEGISGTEVSEKRANLLLGVFGAERMMRVMDTSTSLREALDRAKKAETSWQGFEKPGPYSFLLHDELHRQLEAAAGRVSAHQSAVAMIDRQVANRQDEIRAADEALRRAKDAAERAGEDAKVAATWRLDAAAQRVKVLGTTASLYQLSRDNTQLRVATATAEMALAKRKVAALGNELLFPETDLAKIKQSSDERAREIDRESAGIEKRQRQLVQERLKLREEIAVLESAEVEDKPRREAAGELLKILEDEVQSLADRAEILAAGRRFGEEYLDVQKARQVLAGRTSHEEKATALKQLEELLARATAFDLMVDIRRQSFVTGIREQANRESPPEAGSPLQLATDRLLAARRAELDAVERFGQDMASIAADLRRWMGDADQLAKAMSWRERSTAIWAKLKSWAFKAWNFEVYQYVDREEVGGEVIAVKRGLVLGWFLGAIGLFVIAYRISTRLVRRLMESLVAKGRAERGQAETWRRWIMMALAVMLALITLHFLKIPLTAFAFLGGALAIGVGFGTQTLFKNFISGIIVLAERKVQVGDILDVDGVAGKVTAIDTRSSTVRSFDGVDVIVPNSLLLENKVINWTLETAKVRRVVKVGVAYGAPLRDVTNILTDCAATHGQIAQDPPPLAVLEDFGTDALMFALYFWIDLRGGGNSMVIGSDLRFMIEKRLSEAGISIAFRQRDLQLRNDSSPRPSADHR